MPPLDCSPAQAGAQNVLGGIINGRHATSAFTCAVWTNSCEDYSWVSLIKAPCTTVAREDVGSPDSAFVVTKPIYHKLASDVLELSNFQRHASLPKSRAAA